jgi:3-oxoacyl-[acyl-carrier protein] reductase/sorbitol-6-phosphate 2-dehydrogenase
MAGLDGRIAIVTGAAGGMGGGISRRFVRDGATVVCVDRADSGERVAELDAIRSGAAEAVRLDVRDLAGLEALVDDVVARHGRLDVMVNNAGIEQPLHEIVDTPEDVYREVMDVNLFGVFAGCRAAGRVMRAQGGGAIINTASQLGKVAFALWGVYSASKAGVIALTQGLARELADHGVRVNAVCPGTFDTPLARRAFTAYGARSGQTYEQVREGYERDSIALHRLGDPEEMGAVCAFLAGDDASFVTGAAINLTGGEQWFF